MGLLVGWLVIVPTARKGVLKKVALLFDEAQVIGRHHSGRGGGAVHCDLLDLERKFNWIEHCRLPIFFSRWNSILLFAAFFYDGHVETDIVG